MITDSLTYPFTDINDDALPYVWPHQSLNLNESSWTLTVRIVAKNEIFPTVFKMALEFFQFILLGLYVDL